MPDSTAEFFDALGRRGHEALLERVIGTIRFDLEHDHGTDHWFVAIANGDVRVSKENREADTVMCTTKALFDRSARGQEHIYAAWLRNALMVWGDLRLGRIFERVLPGPPNAHHPRAWARERSRQP